MPLPGVCRSIMEARHKQEGYGSFANPDRLFNQDFQQLKHYCITRGVRFIDKEFPPDKNSIGRGILSCSDLDQVEWLRPAKIAPNPAFILDGISRFDFGQGAIGNCWFLASIGALTFQNDVLWKVVPDDQTFDEKYCGLFHFKFWRFGRWLDVVIDDKLPTIGGRLIFVHSKDLNEFWPALLEKAYAKVCGSYVDMSCGTTAEAMMDFTGGVHMCIQLSDPPENLWELICRAGQSKSLMGCGTHPGAWTIIMVENFGADMTKYDEVTTTSCFMANHAIQMETSANKLSANGLVQGHAYTVTGFKQMMSGGQVVNLVRLWNPWGQGEWNGDWSDRSSLWQTVSAKDRELCLSVADDGEFWMTLNDFCKFYTDLDICSLSPDFLGGNSFGHWKTSMYEGRWVAGTTAGGCMNNKDRFWTNPQYRVKIDGEYSEKDGEKNVMISLMQKSDKRHRHQVPNLHIGFTVFEAWTIIMVEKFGADMTKYDEVTTTSCFMANHAIQMVKEQYRTQRGKFPPSFFSSNASVAQTKTFLDAREVMEFLFLKPAEYLIVPSTFGPNETASFLLTIISKTETHGYENSGDYKDEPVKMLQTVPNVQDDQTKQTIFRQYSDKYEEVDAEQLQSLLNEKILKGDLKSGGFSIDACRSMVALMDTSISGKLNSEEFLHLWQKVIKYKDIFFHTDVSRTGTLSLSELRNALLASEIKIRDDMLNLLALRYGASSGHMTLESFISLILRLDRMDKIFKELSDGKAMTLQESEWMYISMYT